MNREIQDYVAYNHMLRGADVLSMFVMDGILQNKDYAEDVLNDPAAITTIFQRDALSLTIDGGDKGYANSYAKDILVLVDSYGYGELALNNYLKMRGMTSKATLIQTVEDGQKAAEVVLDPKAQKILLYYMPKTWAAVAASKPAMDAVAASKPAMDAVIASKPAMDAVAASKPAMDAVIASKPAMDAVAASKPAMDAVAASKPAMDAVAASKPAMDAVAASKPAMDAVIASSTALRAICSNQVSADAVKDAIQSYRKEIMDTLSKSGSFEKVSANLGSGSGIYEIGRNAANIVICDYCYDDGDTDFSARYGTDTNKSIWYVSRHSGNTYTDGNGTGISMRGLQVVGTGSSVGYIAYTKYTPK